MDRASLKDALKRLLIESLDLRKRRPEDIADEAPLFGGGLGLDSLDALQLAMAVEEQFGVTVPEGEEGKRAFASIDALADYITLARTQ